MTDTSWGEVRTTPSDVGIVAGFAKPGDQFRAIAKDDWYMVVVGRFTGAYISKKSIRELPNAAPVGFGKVQGQEIPVMELASMDSGIKGVINNTPELVLEAQGDWYKIVEGDYTGYFIAAKYIQNVDESAISALQKRGYVSNKAAKPPSNVQVKQTKASQVEAAPSRKKRSDEDSESESVKAPAVIPPAAPWDNKMEQRFDDQVAKVFKNKKPPAEIEVLMPVIYEGFENPLGQVNTFIKKDQPLQIETETLFKYLKRVVVSDWLKKKEVVEIFSKDKLKKDFLSDPNNWVSVKAFENSGISIVYDEAKLAIRISIPPEMRRPGVSSLSRQGFVADLDNVEKPSLLSSFININATESFDTRQTSFDDRRTPLAAQLENGTNFAGLVLEAYGSYLENRDPGSTVSPFTRQDVRLVKDFPDNVLRVTAGDLIFPVIGFQNVRPMAGISFASQFSMSPSRLTYPSGNYEFFLQRKSKVYVFVNNNLAQSLDLPAGKHQLQEFPFAAGSNDIRLEILDDVGRSDTVQFSYFSNSEMLRSGLNQFSYAVGEPSTQVGSERVYDSTNPTYSVFHRYGLSDHHTIGANAQADKSQLLVGLDHLLSTDIGYFKTEAAMTQNAFLGSGGAGALHYIYSDYQGEEKTQRTKSLGLIYHTENLGSFERTLTSYRKRLEVTGSYTTGLSRIAALSLGLNYSFNYRNAANVSDGFVLNGGLNHRFENGVSASFTLRHSKSDLGVNEISGMVFLLWAFPKERQVATALVSSVDSSSIIGWNYNPSSGADGWNVAAEAKSNTSQQGYTGQANFNGNRARASINYQELIQKDTTVTAGATPATGTTPKPYQAAM